MPSPAEELRAAVAMIRGHAEKALAESRAAVGGEEWFDPIDLRSSLEDDYGPCKATAEHIAMWSPTAVLAVAALLEQTADVADDLCQWSWHDDDWTHDQPCDWCRVRDTALALAQAIGSQT